MSVHSDKADDERVTCLQAQLLVVFQILEKQEDDQTMRADVEFVLAGFESDLDVGGTVIRLPCQSSSRMSVVVESFEISNATGQGGWEYACGRGPLARPEGRGQDGDVQVYRSGL